MAIPEAPAAADHVVVDRYTDIVGPSNEMLGPLRDGGRIEFFTVPGCWGPMITPALRSGHEVSLPVGIEGAEVGDSVALRVELLEQRSAATTSGTHAPWDGNYLSDPFVAGICPTCRDAGRHFLYPDSYLEGTGDQAVRCSVCSSPVNPFHMVQGYTIAFDEAKTMGLTVSKARAAEIAANAAEWNALGSHAHQHPISALARADLEGIAARCRISIGNLGSIPAVDMPSSHNCGDFGSFLVGAEHEFGLRPEQLGLRTDAHMDIDSVRTGSVLIVPVKVQGAGIYAGDVHAMIGDGEVAVHATDVAARVVVRAQVLKGLTLEGPLLLPPAEDLPFLARPFSSAELDVIAALSREHATRSEGRVLPLQVLGSGPMINDAVDNAVGRASRLLGMGVDEVQNRATIAGAAEIGRLPGYVQLTLMVPIARLERVGLAEIVEGAYGALG